MSKHPISEQSIATNGGAAVTRWADAEIQLEQAHKYWLATVNHDSSPHVVITTSGETLDLVVEGEAKKITDDDTLKRVAEVYVSKYDWHITPHDGAYDAPYGAPAAGLPPYELYQIHITKVISPGSN